MGTLSEETHKIAYGEVRLFGQGHVLCKALLPLVHTEAALPLQAVCVKHICFFSGQGFRHIPGCLLPLAQPG